MMIAFRGRRFRRPRVNFICLLFLVLAAGLQTWVVPAQASQAGVTMLGDDSRVMITDQGEVVFDAGRWIGDRSLLTVSSPWESSSLLQRFPGRSHPFFMVTREGVDGGHRGLSRHADDDGDGLVDEDPANGRDDDGDGKIDEDFAAIGDQMTIVHNEQGEFEHHLEGYHWDYVHMNEMMVLSWSARASNQDEIVLTLPIESWRETIIDWSTHKTPGHNIADQPIFVAEIPGDDFPWWVGVTVLDQGPQQKLQLDGPDLTLSFDDTLKIGIAVTRTMSQLRCRLATAHAVYWGARAAPDQPATPWIVPPPPRVFADEIPTAKIQENASGQVVLELNVSKEWPLLLDPEMFIYDGNSLGTPNSITWTPLGVSDSETWSFPGTDHQVRSEDIASHPYADLPLTAQHQAAQWSYEFSSMNLRDEKTLLTFKSLCGLEIEFMLPPPVLRATHVSQNEKPASHKTRPSLSPGLLESYPNPFVDQLNIRFTVPLTVGEGFVWDDEHKPHLKAEDLIPYQESSPRVMMKIYSIAGHEVATLFDERCDVGSRSTSWNGQDTMGRPMAAGTYFCKLQIENWSVTQRVALLR